MLTATKQLKTVPKFDERIFVEGDDQLTVTTTDVDKVEDLKLQHFRIDLNEELAPPPVAMEIFQDGEWMPMLTKGNFSIITGPPKQRKTFLVNMLQAEAVGKKGQFFRCTSNGVNLSFDTEQAKYKVQQNAKKIVHLAGTDQNLHVYSFRTLDPKDRLRFIEQALHETENINFVTIDGIIDLETDPILQADQAQHIVQKLMQWSEKFHIHICCVLHFNKTVSTLLGHLGSFSHRKADAVISVTKDKQNENISIVEAVDTREKPFRPFAFIINESGLPEIIGEHIKEENTGKKKLMAKDVPYETHTKHIEEIFSGNPGGFNYNDLIVKMKLKYQEYGIEFGDTKAREFLSHCENLGLLCHNGKKGKAAKYMYDPVNTVKSKK